MAELKIPSLGIRSILGPNYSDLEYQSCINTPVLIQIILEYKKINREKFSK